MIKSIYKGILISILITGGCHAKTFDAHSVTIKPIDLSFYSYTFGHKRYQSKINGVNINTFRSYPGLAGTRLDRCGTGYDLEVGYMFTSSIEAFAMIGFSIDRPLYQSIIKFIPFFADTALHFKRRPAYNASIGGRYYFDTESSWIPFVGFNVGAVFQNKTKAQAFDYNPNRNPSVIPIGHVTLQKRKTFADGALQLGVDYRFTDVWHLTMMTGLKYQPRAGSTTSSVRDQRHMVRPITYKDNWNKWVIPFIVSLKIVL